MSKKKAFSGSPMTLKDFHGGSIPTDLRLPSAPGAILNPSDRSGFDRQIPTAWGNPMGRSDHRSRPGLSGATHNFNEKASFLSHPENIGRNFDEDERKPLDGVSTPRRTNSDENIGHRPIHPEVKSESSSGRLSDRQVSSHLPNLPNSGRYTVANAASINSQNASGNIAQAVSSSYPNAWGIRKDVAPVSKPLPSTFYGVNVASRFAQASALEKVSSGRWQSKPTIHHELEVGLHELEVGLSGTEAELRSMDSSTQSSVNLVNESNDYNAMWGKPNECTYVIEDGIQGSQNELLGFDRARSPMHSEASDRNPSNFIDGIQLTSTEVKVVGSQMQKLVPSEVSEQPKLKLFPRSKPLDSTEVAASDIKQTYLPPGDASRLETIIESYGSANPPKPGSTSADGGNRPYERPKLNFKPRSQSLEHLEGTAERERQTLFGGAQSTRTGWSPSLTVLKERGIEDVALNDLDQSQSPNWAKHSLPSSEILEPAALTAQHSGRAEGAPIGQRIERDTERNYHQDTERAKMQRNLSDNRRIGRGIERQQWQQELRPEPETWRKTVEQPRPALDEPPGLRCGKGASALDLAQAFSRSISDAKTVDQFSSQRVPPGRNQLSFSRLTDAREFYSGPASGASYQWLLN